MTWRELQLTLQIAAEERVGTVMRDRQRLARAIEDEAWEKAAATAKEMGV